MRDVTPIEKLVFEREADEIGGMILLILGEPGAGKTMALTRMVMMDMGIDHVGNRFDPEKIRRTPLWTGQKSCQWIIPAAQGIPVKLWMHETINDFHFYTTGSKADNLKKRKVDIENQEGLDIEIESFESSEELVENLARDRMNVYYFPGKSGGEKEKYFYQKKNLELGQALNDRDYRDHITWNADEIQNIAPDYSRRPFYELQMQKFPTEWQDFRKNAVSKRGTSHGYAEINWKFYDLKANGILYMQGGRVHKNHGEISQSAVNNMKRGECVAPGFEAGEFAMPQKPCEVFSWLPENSDVQLQMKFNAKIPDVRPDEMEVESWLDDLPISKDDIEDLITLREAEEMSDLGRTALKERIYSGEIQAVKLEGKHWVLSVTQLLNNSKVPT